LPKQEALKIDPEYDLARQNLAILPKPRQSGELPAFAIRDPMANAKVPHTIVYQ
jgi:hypothetical protein